jgi:5-methylthioadenosine/S-adenosylhomocysteine deaminase
MSTRPRAVARAARDVGVRIGFAMALRDRNGIGYCDDATMLDALRPGIRDAVQERLAVKPVAPAQQLALVDEVAGMVEADGHGDHVDVQYGPTAVQWCSTPLLEAVARASADTGRPVHMHLLETRYQRAWADQAIPGGIVSFLDDIGLLTPAAHAGALHLGPARRAGADRRARRHHRGEHQLQPGPEVRHRAAARDARARGAAWPWAWTAWPSTRTTTRCARRLAYALHRGWGFDTTMTPAQLWRFASRGRIAVGAGASPADLTGARLGRARRRRAVRRDNDPLDLLLARANGRHIAQVLVGGRVVVDGGRVRASTSRRCRPTCWRACARRWRPMGGTATGAPPCRRWPTTSGPFYRRGRWAAAAARRPGFA